jgi:NAD(P)H-dependent FMN reductase
MNHIERAVLLIGSAKRKGESTSEALGSYLMAKMNGHSVATTTFAVHRALRTPERTTALLEAVDACDVFVLAFPLYVDTLPSLATRALEAIAVRRSGGLSAHKPWFLAIANCGFPEADHNDVALAICEQFAVEARMRWAGGLALGAGGAVNGGAIRDHSITRNVAKALDLTAAALAADQPAPADAINLMRRPLMPQRLYLFMGSLGWHRMAQVNGVWRRLGDRPFSTSNQ